MVFQLTSRASGAPCHKETGGWPEDGRGNGRSGAGVLFGGGWALFALLVLSFSWGFCS